MARYCKPGHLKNNHSKLEQAFLLRETSGEFKENYLSANWVEYFNKDTVDEALKEIYHLMPIEPCIFKPSPNGGFVVLKKAWLIDTVSKFGYQIQIERDQNDICHESHLGIFMPKDIRVNRFIALRVREKIQKLQQTHKCVFENIC